MDRNKRTVFTVIGTGLVLLVCAVAGVSSFSHAVASDIASSEISERTDWLVERRRLLDQAQFDIDALLDQLDYEPAEIIEFVSTQISYDAYPGVLRGALGTLVSRSGNDLDQALLLATLLRDAGSDARIVAGEMPSAMFDSKQLLLQSMPPPPAPYSNTKALENSDSEGSAFIRAMPKKEFGMFESAQQDKLARNSLNETSIDAAAQRLRKRLKDAGVLRPLMPATTGPSTAYHWVEYRDADSDPWTAVHPIYAGNTPPAPGPKALTYFGQNIPEELQQRVRIQAFIERDWHGKKETFPLIPTWERPAASLTGVTVTYSNVPNGFNNPQIEDGDAALAATTLFIPSFSAGVSDGIQAFDLNGNTVPLAEAASQMAGIFQTVGGKMGTAADALVDSVSTTEDPSDDSPARFIQRQWLEITLIRPGLADKKIIRELAHWNGDNDAMRRSLARTVLLRFETGITGSAASLDRGLAAMERTLYGLNQPAAAADTGAAGRKEETGSPTDGFAFDTEIFLATSEAWSKKTTKGRSYRPEPTVLARYLPYGRIDGQRNGFDIINATRVVLDSTDAAPSEDGALTIGVTDTWVEHLLFSQLGDKPDSAFQRLAGITKAEWVVTDSAGDPRLSALDPAVKQVMTDQLSAGNVLVIPVTAAGQQCDAWWQYDPVTGAALGMTANGWGGVTSEYITQTIAAYGRVRGGAKVLGCTALYGALRSTVALSTALALNDAAGFADMDVCAAALGPGSQYYVPCQLMFFALAAGSATPANVLANPAAFMRLCMTTLF